MKKFIEEYKELCRKHMCRIAVDIDFSMSVIPVKSVDFLNEVIKDLESNSNL